MNRSLSANQKYRRNERGSSTVKFVIIMAIIVVAVYMGVQYVPVAYNYHNFKTYMQESVDSAFVSGQGTEVLRAKLLATAKDYGVPPEAKINTSMQEGRVTATVQFTRPIVMLPSLWTYNYTFDYTARSTEFLGTK